MCFIIMTATNPLYGIIYEYLHARIESGQLAVGDRVPTERELANHFKVSRITAKRALEMLTNEGLISRRPGKGSFVMNQFPPIAMESGVGQSATARFGIPTLIGLVLPELGESYGLRLLSGIERTADESNVFLTICRSYGRQETEEQAIQKLVRLGVGGLIVFPVNGEHYNPEILRLHLNGFPIVLVDKHLPGVPVSAVTSDNTTAAYSLTQHLISLGHRKIAFCSPPTKDTVTLEDRWTGFLAALQDATIPFSPQWSLTSLPSDIPTDKDSGYSQQHHEMIADFLSSNPEITAVVATEFQVASHLFMVAQRLGKHVPTDLSITCFDGPSSGCMGWTFTHIRQDEQTMGKMAVEILMQYMNKQEPVKAVSHTLSGQLVIGDSTAPAK